jgi:hypothetical protein
METNRIIRGIFSAFGILAITTLFSCQMHRDGGRAGSQTQTLEEFATSPQAVEALDERIRELSQEMSNVETELMVSERIGEEGFRESWRNIELKRHELNRNIELYNEAVTLDRALEASEIRADINKLVGEIESDLQQFRGEFGGEMQNQQPQDYQYQEQPEVPEYE